MTLNKPFPIFKWLPWGRVRGKVMGYNTTFTGVLKFTNDPTARQLARLKPMFCEDNQKFGGNNHGYIDLRLADDFSGLEWEDETEKTYDLEKNVNVVIDFMQKEFPDFGLEGELLAQGEEPDDRWRLVIVDGRSQRIEWPRVGDKMICPGCGHKFFINEAD